MKVTKVNEKNADMMNPKQDTHYEEIWKALRLVLLRAIENGPGYGGIPDPGEPYWKALKSVVETMNSMESSSVNYSAGKKKAMKLSMDEYWKTLDADDKKYIAEQVGLKFVREMKKHGPVDKETDLKTRQEAVKDINGAANWLDVPIRWRNDVRNYRYENQLEVGSLGYPEEKVGATRREKIQRWFKKVNDWKESLNPEQKKIYQYMDQQRRSDNYSRESLLQLVKDKAWKGAFDAKGNMSDEFRKFYDKAWEYSRGEAPNFVSDDDERTRTKERTEDSEANAVRTWFKIMEHDKHHWVVDAIHDPNVEYVWLVFVAHKDELRAYIVNIKKQDLSEADDPYQAAERYGTWKVKEWLEKYPRK